MFASYLKITRSVATYYEPSAPRIVVDRATGTYLSAIQLNDVRMDDEGMYKIEISIEFPETVAAAFRAFNLTVLVSLSMYLHCII